MRHRAAIQDLFTMAAISESKRSSLRGISTTTLIDATVLPETNKRYRLACKRFIQWAILPTNTDELKNGTPDDLLCHYIHYLYHSTPRKPISWASDCLKGIFHFLPQYKDIYPFRRSRTALKGWQRLHPTTKHPPLTWDYTCLIAYELQQKGHEVEAVATLLAFDCLLRIGELCRIKNIDVSLYKPQRLGGGTQTILIHLPTTKTGRNQYVEIHNRSVELLFRRRYKDILAKGDPNLLIFPFKPAQYRAKFKAAVKTAELNARYVPHSLRHGGATHLFKFESPRWDFARIKLRGRWKADGSIEGYLQENVAILMTMDHPYTTNRRAEWAGKDPEEHIYPPL